jgi:hypothetical protein
MASSMSAGSTKKHQDRKMDILPAEFQGLPELAHPQELGPGCGKLAGHRHHAMTVGIRFHHGQHPGARRQSFSRLVIIVPQGSQIDFYPAQGHPAAPFSMWLPPWSESNPDKPKPRETNTNHEDTKVRKHEIWDMKTLSPCKLRAYP